jgi:ABC-type amino acid transport substrate-binding protein
MQSNNTSPGTVPKWKEALEAARQDGTYNAIFKKWFE